MCGIYTEAGGYHHEVDESLVALILIQKDVPCDSVRLTIHIHIHIDR